MGDDIVNPKFTAPRHEFGRAQSQPQIRTGLRLDKKRTGRAAQEQPRMMRLATNTSIYVSNFSTVIIGRNLKSSFTQLHVTAIRVII